MRFELKKLPVILIAEGKTIGEIQGFVIVKEADGRYKVTSIYGIWKESDLMKNEREKYFSIPLKYVTMGPDAIMIWDEKMIHMMFAPFSNINMNTEIYDEQGENWGKVGAIHVDEDLIIDNIEGDDKEIHTRNILSIGDTIVVWSDLSKKTYSPVSKDKLSQSKRDNTFPEDTWMNQKEENSHEEETIRTQEKAVDLQIESIDAVEEIEDRGKEQQISSTLLVNKDDDIKENNSVPINPKYQYLLGKRFLEQVKIEDKIYSKGTEITPEIIQQAIQHNTILTVIMNAED